MPGLGGGRLGLGSGVFATAGRGGRGGGGGGGGTAWRLRTQGPRSVQSRTVFALQEGRRPCASPLDSTPLQALGDAGTWGPLGRYRATAVHLVRHPLVDPQHLRVAGRVATVRALVADQPLRAVRAARGPTSVQRGQVEKAPSVAGAPLIFDLATIRHDAGLRRGVARQTSVGVPAGLAEQRTPAPEVVHVSGGFGAILVAVVQDAALFAVEAQKVLVLLV